MNNADSSTPVPHHHHHHHHRHPDGTIHHHHSHIPKSAPPREKTPPAPRIPTITINNEPILSTVQNLPRRHLGTVVYSPSVDPASSKESARTKLDYATGQYSIPRCDGKENCTLTVRVPRFYLSHDELLHVCARRAVWGTDVYTDDSDPLCAIVHAGWIRGAWPPDVDINMIEPNLKNVTLDTHSVDWKDTILDKPPPESPMIPPPDKDLHITVLILPALEAYTSRVAHGVKSRPWGSDHDGLSFRIEKIAWVDDGRGKVEERRAPARKKRLDRAARNSMMVNGRGYPPVKLTAEKLRASKATATPSVAATPA